LLVSLPGILSARVVPGPDGQVREIHVLASHELLPKHIARNIESALSAGLGIEVDRRVISIAQVRAEDAGRFIREPAATGATAPPRPVREMSPEPPAGQSAAPRPGHTDPAARDPAATAPPAAGAEATGSRAPGSAAESGRRPAASFPRLLFLGYDVRTDSLRRVTCWVTLRSGTTDLTGEAQGTDTHRGRAEAAAKATFAALAAHDDAVRIGLDGVAIVEAHGRNLVLVAARALDGRHAVALTGAAILEDSPEEAAILAALQATNRWRASL